MKEEPRKTAKEEEDAQEPGGGTAKNEEPPKDAQEPFQETQPSEEFQEEWPFLHSVSDCGEPEPEFDIFASRWIESENHRNKLSQRHRIASIQRAQDEMRKYKRDRAAFLRCPEAICAASKYRKLDSQELAALIQ